MACCRSVLNKVIVGSRAATRFTTVVPLHAAASRRGIRTSVPDIYDEPILGPILYGIPHTLFHTTKLTPGGEGEQCINLLSLMRSDPKLKCSLHFPGNHRLNYNKAGISIHLDLGLEYKYGTTYDEQIAETKFKSKHNALFIKGYVQKSNIRNYYYARINLRKMLKENILSTNSLKTEIKNGVLMVTIPWLND